MKKVELWTKVCKEDNGKLGYLIVNLAERWTCERDYEDINDYLKVIQESIPEAVKIHKRPFGVTCKCDDGNIRIEARCSGGNLTLTAKNA